MTAQTHDHHLEGALAVALGALSLAVIATASGAAGKTNEGVTGSISKNDDVPGGGSDVVMTVRPR